MTVAKGFSQDRRLVPHFTLFEKAGMHALYILLQPNMVQMLLQMCALHALQSSADAHMLQCCLMLSHSDTSAQTSTSKHLSATEYSIRHACGCEGSGVRQKAVVKHDMLLRQLSDLAHLLRVAQRHVMQPAGSSHGITDRRAWKPAEHPRHARRLSQTKDADWVSAAGGWGVQRGAASILWHWRQIHHA